MVFSTFAFLFFFSGLPCFGGISNGVSMVVQSISLCLLICLSLLIATMSNLLSGRYL